MIRPKDSQIGQDVRTRLSSFVSNHSVPGIQSAASFNCFVEQIVDSIKRIKYIQLIRSKEAGDINLNVLSNLFDPLKGAIWHLQRGNVDEAFWLVFLSTHFGKNKNTGWRLARDVYGGLNDSPFWTWERTSQNPGEFREWIEENQQVLRSTGRFGNHRKYENLSGIKPRGTGAAIASYISWIGENHETFVLNAIDEVGDDPQILFDYLYNSMGAVISFGRTAKFDYLTMVGKMNLANIVPGSTYLNGATGPLQGAKLLFGERKGRKELEVLLQELEESMGLYFGMQVLEDSLCNWQKSPKKYIYFRG